MLARALSGGDGGNNGCCLAGGPFVSRGYVFVSNTFNWGVKIPNRNSQMLAFVSYKMQTIPKFDSQQPAFPDVTFPLLQSYS